MDREKMVEALVNCSIDSALSDPQREWLIKIFRDGIVGFNRMDESRLIQEMWLRGLMDTDDSDLIGCSDEDEPEEETIVMWSGMFYIQKEKSELE